MTINDFIYDAEQRLISSETARLDAELLLCHILNCERSWLYAHSHSELRKCDAGNFHHLINQRQKGLPIAYLTGRREFWSLDFEVNSNTLIPRPETECLVETALQLIPADTNWQILDLGTGCGAIAIALASERPGCNVTAIDKCPAALQIARKNAEKHHIQNIQFILSDWFTEIFEMFDLIISNPPYIQDEYLHLDINNLLHEPELALSGGEDGLDSCRQIIRTAPDYLKTGGWIILEHAHNQGNAVSNMLLSHGFCSVENRFDLTGHPRMCIGRLSV